MRTLILVVVLYLIICGIVSCGNANQILDVSEPNSGKCKCVYGYRELKHINWTGTVVYDCGLKQGMEVIKNGNNIILTDDGIGILKYISDTNK